MKQGRTLSELAAEIERQQESKQDYLADTRKLDMTEVLTADDEGNPRAEHQLVVGNGEKRFEGPITEHCHRQIAERLKIPAVYYRRMREEAPELLTQNVNTWFNDKPEKRMVRTLDGRARAFLSDRYARIDNHAICEAALPIVQEVGQDLGLRVASCEVTESRLYLKFVTERVQADVKVGDPVQQGLVISNSEVGLGSVSVTPMVYRLVCLNGMVSGGGNGRGLKRHHVGCRHDAELEGILSDNTKKLEDAATLGKVRDVVRAALDGTIFQDTVDRLRFATQDHITGDPVKAVELLGKTLSLTDGESSGVLRHLIEGGDLSRYGAVQAVTRFAQDDALTYDRASELEIAGGKVLDLSCNDWATIAEAA